MTYTTLPDLDHTLLDSDASELAAYNSTLRGCGVGAPGVHFDTYQQINGALWAAVERGEILPDDLRTQRFELFAAQIGLDADPETMADAFVHGLGNNGDLYPGARAVLEKLAATKTLALITNGLSKVQRTRIERLGIGHYFDAIVISAEVGFTKPGAEIFDIAFDCLGHPAKDTVLMVGDSLSSDIRGGSNYRIATCWYNPNGKTAGPDDRVTHVIKSLAYLPILVECG